MYLSSKQSSLISFYALPSGGKPKVVLVHWKPDSDDSTFNETLFGPLHNKIFFPKNVCFVMSQLSINFPNRSCDAKNLFFHNHPI